MPKVHVGQQVLTDGQLAGYREHARKALSASYNLFAEMVLRVIASHETLALELAALRHQRSDRDIELEFVTSENEDLRRQLSESETERRRLHMQLKQYQKEISLLKRSKIDLPPSWG